MSSYPELYPQPRNLPSEASYQEPSVETILKYLCWYYLRRKRRGTLKISFSPLSLSTFPLLAFLPLPALSHRGHNTVGVFVEGVCSAVRDSPPLRPDLPEPPLACRCMGRSELGSWCFLWYGLLLILSQPRDNRLDCYLLFHLVALIDCWDIRQFSWVNLIG